MLDRIINRLLFQQTVHLLLTRVAVLGPVALCQESLRRVHHHATRGILQGLQDVILWEKTERESQ